MAEKKETHESEMVYIQSRLNAPKNQRNSFGNYNYRSCEDILEAVKPLLREKNCILTVSDEIVQIADRIYVKATATMITPSGVVYNSSAYAREPLQKKGMDESQVTGAASSYARKYALNGLFCIDDNKDADTGIGQEPTTNTMGNAVNDKLLLEKQEAFEIIKPNIETASSLQYLTDIYNQNTGLHDYKPFMAAMTKRRKEIENGRAS